MDKPIVNRVANSNLMVIDLEDFYPQGKRECIDISEWLFEGIVLKEKEFRKGKIEYTVPRIHLPLTYDR